MRRTLLIVAVVVFAAACTTVERAAPPETSTDPGNPTTTVVPSPDIPSLLVDHEIRDVEVGDRTLTLAIADSPSLRAQGLMEVEDLGDLDGMLFYWRHEAGGGGFWMKNTVIPLDVVFFLEDGAYAGRASMEPCLSDAETCPTYSPGEGVDYRFAIEADPGDLDWIDESTVIVYSD
jgi:hypothetical protein